MPLSLNQQNNVPQGSRSGPLDLLKGINLSALWTPGDQDLISGVSATGGDRYPTNGRIVGGTSNPVSYPVAPNTRPTGGNDGSADVSGQYDAYGNYIGGGGGAADTSAADLAYLDDQERLLRSLLGSAQNTLNNGLTQIGDSYNREFGRTDQKRVAADQGYDTQREDTYRDRSAAVGQVNAGARTLSDSVRRMLGMASGSNSSAFREVAPNLIARDASQKRSSVFDTSGKNLRDIDTADNETALGFSQYLEDLERQKKEKESGLREGILSQEQNVNRDLGEVARQRDSIRGGTYGSMRAASAPFQANIDSKQSELDGLFERFRSPYQTRDVQARAPELADYTVDRTAVQANNQAPASPDSPYQQFLKKKFNGEAA